MQLRNKQGKHNMFMAFHIPTTNEYIKILAFPQPRRGKIRKFENSAISNNYF